jgi:hypothetical protein
MAAQILLSAVAAAHRSPPGQRQPARPRQYRLKDLGRPELVFQVVHPTSGVVPALAT